MRLGVQRNSLTATCILLAMVLAFAVKAIIPAGFMPTVNKDGFTEIVICSGMGEKTITVPSENSAPTDHKQSSSDLCAYQAAGAHKILIDVPAAFITLLEQSERQKLAPFSTTISSATKNNAHLVRGPPLLV